MQKTAISLFMLILIANYFCFAQTTYIAGIKSLPEHTKFISAYENPDTISGSGHIPLNNINIKAVRDFLKSYKNPVNVIWTILADGFRVHFFYDDVQTRVFYNKQGNRESMVRYYNEDKLPFTVRHLVKSNYYDFSIFNVTEVSKGNNILYLVKIEDKTCWKTIKVADGEMEIVEEYLKS